MEDKLIKPVFFLKLVVTALLILVLGCSTRKPIPPIVDVKPHPPVKTDVKSDTQTGNSFYFFTISQFNKKAGDLEKALDYLKQAIIRDPDSSYLKRELAQLYWQKKDAKTALDVVNELMANSPNDVENLILFGRINHAFKNWEEAKFAYEKILEIDPSQKDIYLLLGGLYTKEGNTDFAIQIYRSMVKEFPLSYIGYYMLGKVNAEIREMAAAEKKFVKALELEPDLIEARYELIALYKARMKNSITPYKEKIILLYKEILQRYPNDIRAQLDLGYFYHVTGDKAKSESILMTLGKRSQTDKDVIRYVVQLYLDRKNFDTALIILEGMRKGAPTNSEIFYVTGLAYHGKSDGENAVQQFLKIDNDSEFFEKAVVHVSFIYQEEGRYKEAIHYLNDIIEKTPGNPEYRLYLGALYEEIQEYDNAEAALLKGIQIEPENSKLHFRLGVVYDKWGRKQDSIQRMKTVIRLSPKDANALNYLGYTYADMGENLDEAKRLIEEALKYKPNDGYIIDSLGWVYFQKGDYAKSLEYLKQATRLVPDDPTILEHLGDVYIKMDKKQKALEIYLRSLEYSDNGNETLGKKIQDLRNEGY